MANLRKTILSALAESVLRYGIKLSDFYSDGIEISYLQLCQNIT